MIILDIINKINNNNHHMDSIGFSQLRIYRLPPQKWPSLHKRCAMCWNDRKSIIQIFPIFSFRVIGVQKDVQKNQFSSKEAKFARKIEIDLTIILRIDDFFLCVTQFLRYDRFYIFFAWPSRYLKIFVFFILGGG